MPQKFNTEESANKYIASQQVQPGEKISADYFVKKMVYPAPPTYKFGVPGTEGTYQSRNMPSEQTIAQAMRRSQKPYIAGRLLDPRLQEDIIYRIRKEYPEISEYAIRQYLNSLVVNHTTAAKRDTGGGYSPYYDMITVRDYGNGELDTEALAHEVAHAIRDNFLQHRRTHTAPYKLGIQDSAPYSFWENHNRYEGSSKEVQQMDELYGDLIDVESQYRKQYFTDEGFKAHEQEHKIQEAFAEHAATRAELQKQLGLYGKDYDDFVLNHISNEDLASRLYNKSRYMYDALSNYLGQHIPGKRYTSIASLPQYVNYLKLMDQYTNVDNTYLQLQKDRSFGPWYTRMNPMLAYKANQLEKERDVLNEQMNQLNKRLTFPTSTSIPDRNYDLLKYATINTY